MGFSRQGFSVRVRALSKAALFFIACAPLVTLAAGCGAKPVAVVNGQSLAEKEFLRLCETTVQVAPNQGTVGNQVLMQWIRNTLLAQEAKRLGVYPSNEAVQARLDTYRRQASLDGGNLDEQLRRQGLTPDVFQRELLSQMVGESVLFKDVTVTDAEVRQTFDQQKAQFARPEQVKISQLTLDSEAKLKQAQADLASNTDFSLVASTHSKDPFASRGGEVPVPLPRAVPQGLPVSKEAVEAAFKLKDGQISDPIKVGATWVIVRLNQKVAAQEPNFDDVKEVIRSTLKQQKAQASGQTASIQRSFSELGRNAKIEINRPEYQAIGALIKGTGGAPGAPGGGGGPEGPPGGPGSMPPPPPGG